MASEFDLIARYFTRPARTAALGVGDDAALLRPTPGMELAISADMLVSGQHFFPDDDPEKLGHKALAVNLSDLAAMGALPRWVLLSLALPTADEAWLAGFSRGFLSLAEAFGVELVGGDTTRGPLNISVTILGEVEVGRALRRDAAQVGDDIWVSGELGGAALGLQHLLGQTRLSGPAAAACLSRLHEPIPRVALGRELLGLAHAAIDISDGLLADLGHILEHSQIGARIDLAAVPTAPDLQQLPNLIGACALAGGDDYELCFSAPANHRNRILAAADAVSTRVTRIGVMVPDRGLKVLDEQGNSLALPLTGYDHFGISQPAMGW
ncbi:MAG: thiamine-phosphate kinase [Hydrogenophilales bacterium CG03_land_8_20_14_0_80_62_28]|nr:thiamine-phosphate kinase [Betaproteobacteria bacterium]OIO79356.1 MAG: thiamine-phosphate kinase [Hydrogenophilaceae bacterium CG1_02_62_390]PIV21761.1 MAG: thiamine-phosphate kinase [Hydrogenophilales bacterium CG03_land_8_20_14_0_80_62_28]